jgi:autotransporter passenger strand-loop-strand repeat protein
VYGVIVAPVLSSGASEFVSSGGTGSASTINSGGTGYVMAGGSASGTTLAGGGDIVYGTDTSATISAGTQVVEGGGIATGTILSGGIEDVLASGVASGTTIRGTGYGYVFSGGTASGTTISAGTLELASGGSANLVTFSGGGSLLLDDAVHFGGLVAGFAQPDRLDLQNIAYVSTGSSATQLSWTQLTSGASASGTLTVSQGGQSANLTLLGAYVAANFHMQSDGVSGTLVTDPPVMATDSGPFTLVAHHP